MKKKASKLQLNRETLRSLTDATLIQAVGGNLSIDPCTRVISDCGGCTGPLDGCPDDGYTTPKYGCAEE